MGDTLKPVQRGIGIGDGTVNTFHTYVTLDGTFLRDPPTDGNPYGVLTGSYHWDSTTRTSVHGYVRHVYMRMCVYVYMCVTCMYTHVWGRNPSRSTRSPRRWGRPSTDLGHLVRLTDTPGMSQCLLDTSSGTGERDKEHKSYFGDTKSGDVDCDIEG